MCQLTAERPFNQLVRLPRRGPALDLVSVEGLSIALGQAFSRSLEAVWTGPIGLMTRSTNGLRKSPSAAPHAATC